MSDPWDDWYSRGKAFGGSKGSHRRFKWSVIDRYLPELPAVLDVGCGDMVFWGGRETPAGYLGLDFSSVVVEKNRGMRPDARFGLWDVRKWSESFRRPVVFCLDVLFHIWEDVDFFAILDNACNWSTERLFVYTLTRFRPPKRGPGSRTMKYREPDIIEGFVVERGFELVERVDSPLHVGGMFVFERLRILEGGG